jgi:hypothetical protein
MKLLIAALLCLAPVTAAADDGPIGSDQGTGPMVVQRLHNTFVVAPDFKISRLDGHDARIGGAYGGLLLDEQWLIGAGGYWLTNGSGDRRLGYGGAIVGWMPGGDRPITFSARALLGWGEARLTDTVSFVGLQDNFPFRDFDSFQVFTPGRPTPSFGPRNVQVRFNQQFFVAEPQVDAVFRMASWLRLDAGAGYRAVSAANRNENRLRGATGSISLQFGSF